MKRIYHRLLAIIAGATQQELAQQVRYLKVENEILRAQLPTRVPLTEKEKSRLVRFGAKLGKALNELTTIVHPSTLLGWIREAAKSGTQKLAKKGRSPTEEEIRELILKLARENDGWGYTRIMGDMKKLGVRPPSRNTVKRILRDGGFDPAPKRDEGTWDEFLTLHAETLWQSDFMSVRSLTTTGVKQLFVLVFLHVGTRRIVVSPSTANPDAAWVKAQADAFIAQLPEEQRNQFYVQHDRDTKFTAEFDAAEAGSAWCRANAAIVHAGDERAGVTRVAAGFFQAANERRGERSAPPEDHHRQTTDDRKSLHCSQATAARRTTEGCSIRASFEHTEPLRIELRGPPRTLGRSKSLAHRKSKSLFNLYVNFVREANRGCVLF